MINKIIIKTEDDKIYSIEVLGRFKMENMIPWIIGKTDDGKILKGLPLNFVNYSSQQFKIRRKIL